MSPPSPIHPCNPDHRNSYDVVIIGSGYGGSIAALRLSQVPGLRVCLLEKGRVWQPHQFPTTFLQLMRCLSIHTPFGTIGSRRSLLQVHLQHDTVSMLGVGLGGGSLVNGGVFLPTPLRARRDPHWPKDWEDNWNSAEMRARAMLQPEHVGAASPFPTTKITDTIMDDIEGFKKDAMQLTISFNNKNNAAGVEQEACKACGNCFHGCPFNAKSSTDKNYLAAAVKAGLEIRTECAVSFITQCPDTLFTSASCSPTDIIDDFKHSATEKRWRVYLNDVEYITADYVVLSAGVHGTIEILLRSKERGLKVSDLLGRGVSCNGNNLAFVAVPRAQTNGSSISITKFSDIPTASRPGPAISNAYTSSLGFTLQTVIVPRNFPHMVYKCMSTLPQGYTFLARLWNDLKHLSGLVPNSNSILVNLIGHDSGDGRMELDHRTQRLRFTPPQDQLLPHKVKAVQKLANRLGGLLYISRFRSTAVHYLGGCNVGNDASTSVTNSSGQVFSRADEDCLARENQLTFYDGTVKNRQLSAAVYNGLYVCDASLIPCSIGVNPCLTIATAAEHVSNRIVRDVFYHLDDIKHHVTSKHIDSEFPVDVFRNENDYSGTKLAVAGSKSDCERIELPQTSIEGTDRRVTVVHETLKGDLDGLPCTLRLVLHMDAVSLRGRAGGRMDVQLVEGGKLYVLDGSVDMCCRHHSRTPFNQYMHYRLLLAAPTGKRYTLDGYKEMRPFLKGLLTWSQSTTLCISLKPERENRISQPEALKQQLVMQGQLHLSFPELLRSILTLGGAHRLTFVKSLLQSIAHTYLTESPQLFTESQIDGTLNAPIPLQSQESPRYPLHLSHELITGDGIHISIIQWPCNNLQRLDANAHKNHPEVVLLLNGYCTESYWLPHEEFDLVRYLLQEGYEPWLLQNRVHPAHASSTNFTIDDLAKYDLPIAFSKMIEVVGQDTPIHVVAHCLGGLTIHMALLGGYLSSSSVASILCTNSSMFFQVTKLTQAKLMLPLLQISMVLAGKNTLLSLRDNRADSWRHRLLRRIARLLPRVERCTCKECEAFSGVFGNIFWHANLRPSVHRWTNNEVITRLPLGALPQLRLVCLAGRAVDAQGNNNYLVHPDRLALPTTYISGGREILVTLDTSAMGHSFMQHHHPTFSHHRVVVPEYGHNDLLIGEHSRRDVFPHILHHLRRVGKGQEETRGGEEEDDKSKHMEFSKFYPWEVQATLRRSSSRNLLDCMGAFFRAFCFLIFLFLGWLLFPNKNVTS